MKKFALLLVIFFGTLHAEYLIHKEQYFPKINDTCQITVEKSGVLSIRVVCSRGFGNCAGGSEINGHFSCRTSKAHNDNIYGVNAGINWILNNYQ